jgi:AcrR family transcriptional regulator
VRGDQAAKPERKRDRQATETRLFQAGVEVMSALGYEAATTKRIAAAAGVNEQLLTRYFGGKAGLLAAVLRSYTKTELLRERSARPQPTGLLRDELIGFLSEADFAADREPFARLALSRAVVDAEVADALDDLRQGCYLPLLLERLREHRARGNIAADADLELMAELLVHLRLGLAAYGRLLFGLDSPRLARIIAAGAEAIAAGLAPAAQPGRKPALRRRAPGTPQKS